MTTMGHLSVWRWKDVPLTRSLPFFLFVFFCNFDFFFLWFLSFIYLSQRALLYILSYVIDESKCGVSFPSLTGSLLLRAGSGVPRCLRRDLSTHLFPPACPSCCHTVTAKTWAFCIILMGFFFGWGRSLRFICRIVSDFPKTSNPTTQMQSNVTYCWYYVILHTVISHFLQFWITHRCVTMA